MGRIITECPPTPLITLSGIAYIDTRDVIAAINREDIHRGFSFLNEYGGPPLPGALKEIADDHVRVVLLSLAGIAELHGANRGEHCVADQPSSPAIFQRRIISSGPVRVMKARQRAG